MSKCNTTNSILDTFLVPNPTDDCLVIFTDKDMSGGVITNCHTPISLTRGALQILFRSSIKGPNTLGDIVEDKGPDIISNTSLWAHQLTADNFFRISVNEPEIRRCEPIPIKAGEKLPVNCPNDFVAAFDGILIIVKVNNSKIVWYLADADIGVDSTDDIASAATYGTFGTTLYPTVSTELGAGNVCPACGTCSGCVSCAACILCAEINALAGVAATLASTFAAAAASSSVALEALRNNNTR